MFQCSHFCSFEIHGASLQILADAIFKHHYIYYYYLILKYNKIDIVFL